MKSVCIFLFLFLLGTLAQAQKYEKAMKEAFDLWDQKENEQAVALFERIAQAEPEKWQPAYYAANVDIVHAFTKGQGAAMEPYLERARGNLSRASERSPENSEITTLEGMLYTAYVSVDPATYGRKYSGKIMNLHQKAISQDPKNPRAHMNLTEYEMGYAKFMGQDISAQCELMKTVVTLFDEYKSEDPFAPRYGKERALQIVETCDKQK